MTSNSENIKPVALAVIELRLSEGISQSVTYSQSAENSVNSIATFEGVSGRSESLFGLSFTYQYCLIVIWEN